MVSSRRPCFYASIWKILQKKIVTLDCGLLVLFSLHHLVLVGNCVSSHPHLLGWFALVPVIGKISFVLSNIKESSHFWTFCTRNIAASNIQPIRRHLFGICGNKPHFKPGVRAEKLGANFKHFLAFCPTPRVANSLADWKRSFLFQPWLLV